MSLALFIAKRIHFSKGDDTQRVSPPAIRIAIAGIAIGLAVMLLTVAIVVGFKQEIRDKISDFGGHLQLLALASNHTYEKHPICYSDSLIEVLESADNVASATPYITKPALLKTESEFLPVVIKSGDVGERDLRISETIARKLHLQTGDKVQVLFVQNDPNRNRLDYGSQEASVKTRTLTVAGTYQTHFNEYDSQIAVGSFDLLQQVSGWDADMASGIEIRLSDFDRLDDTYSEVSSRCSQTQDRRGTQLAVQSIEQQNPQIFGWLDLLDTNVWVILGLMSVVSAFTMTGGLLIIILERTRMIGLLKALGCTDGQLRRTFLYIALFLTLKGLLWGNFIGLGLCAIQRLWHPVGLDPENYYLEWVPIDINLWQVVALNAGTLLVTLIVLLGPSALIAKILPGKVLATE